MTLVARARAPRSPSRGGRVPRRRAGSPAGRRHSQRPAFKMVSMPSASAARKRGASGAAGDGSAGPRAACGLGTAEPRASTPAGASRCRRRGARQRRLVRRPSRGSAPPRPARPPPTPPSTSARRERARRRRHPAGGDGARRPSPRSSRTKCAAVGRAAGSFDIPSASRYATSAGARGARSRSGRGRASECARSHSAGELSGPISYGERFPENTRYSVSASEYTSAAAVAGRPATISGATNCGVPASRPVAVTRVEPAMRLSPKSPSLAMGVPDSGSSTLPGLTSRWTTPASCAATSACAMASPTARPSATSNGSDACTRAAPAPAAGPGRGRAPSRSRRAGRAGTSRTCGRCGARSAAARCAPPGGSAARPRAAGGGRP